MEENSWLRVIGSFSTMKFRKGEDYRAVPASKFQRNGEFSRNDTFLGKLRRVETSVWPACARRQRLRLRVQGILSVFARFPFESRQLPVYRDLLDGRGTVMRLIIMIETSVAKQALNSSMLTVSSGNRSVYQNPASRTLDRPARCRKSLAAEHSERISSARATTCVHTWSSRNTGVRRKRDRDGQAAAVVVVVERVGASERERGKSGAANARRTQAGRPGSGTRSPMARRSKESSVPRWSASVQVGAAEPELRRSELRRSELRRSLLARRIGRTYGNAEFHGIGPSWSELVGQVSSTAGKPGGKRVSRLIASN